MGSSSRSTAPINTTTMNRPPNTMNTRAPTSISNTGNGNGNGNGSDTNNDNDSGSDAPDDELEITSRPRIISPDKQQLVNNNNNNTNNTTNDVPYDNHNHDNYNDNDNDDDLSYMDNMDNNVGNKKKVRSVRPWKQSQAKQYDSILTDDVDICGIASALSPIQKLSKHNQNSNVNGVNLIPNDDANADDDDISYDESTAMTKTKHTQKNGITNTNTNTSTNSSMDELDDLTMNARWSKQTPSSPEELHSAHLKGISLAAEKAAKLDLSKSFDSEELDLELDLDDDQSLASKNSASSRKSNHQQVRLEALKLLELANHTGNNPSKYMVREGAVTGSEKFRNMKVQGKEKGMHMHTSALRGLGFKKRGGKGYEKMGLGLGLVEDEADADAFTTNPIKSPVKGKMDDVEIHEVMDGDDEEAHGQSGQDKNKWGSRYSIDRHLRALHGGLTSQQVLSKMDRDHYNKLNQNTSTNGMFKTSPHENDDDRWEVSQGKKEDQHKNRLWYTWVESVKGSFANVAARYEASSSAQWRSADHSTSTPKKGIFTGIAMTNFLERLSPTSRENAARNGSGNGASGNSGNGSAFQWGNVNLVDNSRDLPDRIFSANDDISYFRTQKRKKMFWIVVLILSLLTLFSTVGTAVHKAKSGRVGGGYISVGEEVNFFVTSDVPFNKADATKLSRELDALHPRDGDFLIHLGDISQASTSLCTFSVYDDAAALLKQSPLPVLVLPGDNDWNDCPMPEAAFDYWMEKLNRFESNFDTAAFPNFPTIARQVGRDENFAFLHKGVLFIAIHLVDGTVQSEREWAVRDLENLQWVEETFDLYDEGEYRAVVMLGHAGYSSKVGDFFWPAMDDLKRINKPVLYLHANDGEGMIEYHPVEDFRKFTAVRMEKGSNVAPVRITIGGGAKPFSFDVTEDR